jgi:DNA-binding response OmpR family regulator
MDVPPAGGKASIRLGGGKQGTSRPTRGRSVAKVLIVDDDQAIVRLISVVLNFDGIEVEKAYSGEEALVSLENDRPDLILLDLSLPGMDGREVFRRVRASGIEVPIIFCSSFGAEGANDELGGQGAVEKPFEPESLLEAVRDRLDGT